MGLVALGCLDECGIRRVLGDEFLMVWKERSVALLGRQIQVLGCCMSSHAS